MHKPLVVLYTHTDAIDVWDMWYGEYEKYLNEYEVCLCVNSGVDIDHKKISNVVAVSKSKHQYSFWRHC